MKLIGTLLLACLAFNLWAQNIVEWRGTNREGRYNEKNLLKKWAENQPQMLWSTEEIGNGYGAPTVALGKVFVNGEIDSLSHLFAFDLNGKLLWKTPNGLEFTGTGYSRNFPGARSAPTVVDSLVYICSGMGRIACIDALTGVEKWGLDIVQKFKGIQNGFGISESLLVEGDYVYCTPGGKEANVVKINRFNGNTVWTSPAMRDTVAYCSPMIFFMEERSVFVNMTAKYIFGLDAYDGSLLWSQKLDSVKYGDQCNTPIFADGSLYCVAEGHGAFKLKVSANCTEIETAWQDRNVGNFFFGFLKIGDNLYAPDRKQKLKRIDCNTGAVVEEIKLNKGSIIEADGMLYVYSDNGVMNLVKYLDSPLEVVSSFKIEKGTKEHFSHPVISSGVLYVRHGKALMAYKITE